MIKTNTLRWVGLGGRLKLFPCANSAGIRAPYLSVYPPAFNDTYVKATSIFGVNWQPYYAANPANSVIGDPTSKAWAGDISAGFQPQRFHFDFGAGVIVKRIYYQNMHYNGVVTTWGIKDFTFWGSNTAGSFADLVYSHDTGWSSITTDTTSFLQHVSANTYDPRFILVTNVTSYRYYAFKCSTNWGDPDFIGVRRIELQVAV